MRVLVIAAHPDDEVLGAGATIARLSTEGHEVHIAILGQGGTFRILGRNELQDCAAAAGTLLGARSVDCFQLPDNQFDAVTLLEVAQTIERVIDHFQPEVIYTHHRSDLNQDHRITNHATLIATRPFGSLVKAVYAYEVPSSTEWAFGSEVPFQPNVFQEITPEQLERKIQAMEMYESERRAAPHPRSPEVLRALATYRGAQAGVPLAEAFELVRSITPA